MKIELSDIKHLENYRGYKDIWVYTPELTASELHIGYLDGEFFSYTSRNVDYTYPERVVDHYIDKIFIKHPSLEYEQTFMSEDYRPYLNALNSKIGMETGKVYNPAPNNRN